jgi:hypothetical protein
MGGGDNDLVPADDGRPAHDKEQPLAMTSRQRVLAAVRHEMPDRVPFNFRLMDNRFQVETGATGSDHEAYFGCDLRRVGMRMPAKPADVPRQEWFAQPTDAAVAECRARVAGLREQGLASFSGYICGSYEELKEWVGDADALTLPYDDPQRLARLVDRITELKMAHYGAYAWAGVDIVHIGDDLGAQSSLILSPQQYRRWYRPGHRAIIEHLRGIRPDVMIAFHCCGHVTPLIGDLIELGVNILEAVQPETMDLAGLKRDYGRDITFWGGVGNQSVLSCLSPEQVVASVRGTLEIMMPGGGYMAAPCHTITEDIPWANVVAFVQAVQRHGAS